MKKRLFSLLLVLCTFATILTVVPITVNAATSGTCGENLTWTLSDNGTLTISGTGSMRDWSYNNFAPWNSVRSNINSVIIENGVTKISDYAFYYCRGLTNITIPNSVISIDNLTRCECSNLTSITIPKSVTSIGWRAFEGCSKLTDVYCGGSEED